MKKLLVSFCLLVLLVSCSHRYNTDQLLIAFSFSVDGQPFVPDEMIYTNAAGNQYEINEIMFFISDVQLIDCEGNIISIKDDNAIHYVDYDIPETLEWLIDEPIPATTYQAIRFTIGLSPEKNISNRFPNPPESNMSWPITLGGGYHYMKINGKWNSPEGIKMLNFHTGIGQLYDDNHTVTEFVHNQLNVSLNGQSFTVFAKRDFVNKLTIDMNINSWFDTPNLYDFNYWGSSIMQNQSAQEVIKENGADAFRLNMALL